MKYIDADRLKAEIEREIYEISHPLKDGYEVQSIGKIEGLSELLEIIDSLQQEQPEVDLENEINRFLSNATMMNKGEWKGKYPISEMGFGVVARHFFNLGLNARKEENK